MRFMSTVCLAVCLVLSPVMAQERHEKTKSDVSLKLKDVALNSKGELHGQLVSPSGKPESSAEVKLHSSSDKKKPATKVKTDKDGRFIIRGLRRGPCMLTVNDQSYAFRVWPEKQAPPKSIRTVALVAANVEVRGQYEDAGASNSIWGMSTGAKLAVGVVIATAIAVPVALSDDDDDAS